MRQTGGSRRSFSAADPASRARGQRHVRSRSHPSNLRATKQPFYGLLQLNDWNAETTDRGGAGAPDGGDVNGSPRRMRAVALVSASSGAAAADAQYGRR